MMMHGLANFKWTLTLDGISCLVFTAWYTPVLCIKQTYFIFKELYNTYSSQEIVMLVLNVSCINLCIPVRYCSGVVLKCLY
jgi:hypothetical protein